MYEKKHQPIVSQKVFLLRLAKNTFAVSFVMFVSLLIGIIGYHTLCQFSWIDSLLNASMILSGMGPTNEIKTISGKLFASFYALFSGVIFITSTGLLLAPIAHRFFHHFFHVEEE